MMQQKKNKNVSKVVAIIFLAIGCLIIGGGGSYYYFEIFNNKAKNVTTDKKETEKTTEPKKEVLDNNNPTVQKLLETMKLKDNVCGIRVLEDATNESLDNYLKLELAMNQIPDSSMSVYDYKCSESDFTDLVGHSFLTGTTGMCKSGAFKTATSPYQYPTAVNKVLLESKINEMFGANTKIEYKSFAIGYTMFLNKADLGLYVRVYPDGVGGTCSEDSIMSYQLIDAYKLGKDLVLNVNIMLGGSKAGSQTITFELDDNGNYIFKELKGNNDYNDSLKSILAKRTY